jgi:hypothetical protein
MLLYDVGIERARAELKWSMLAFDSSQGKAIKNSLIVSAAFENLQRIVRATHGVHCDILFGSHLWGFF